MHEELFPILQDAIENQKPDNVAVAAPRGNAKSTLVSFALIIWCAVYQKKHYIILVSDTADQANDFLGNIKSEFEDNEVLISDFGTQIGMVWTSSDIITNLDVRIQALGMGKKIRGRRYKQYRPDLIIADDLENDENVASEDQRKKNLSWWTKAASKAGDERTDKIMIGTILHYDSLLNTLLKNPTYLSRKYQAVLQWSNSPLWDEWQKLITNLEDQQRMETARAFFDANMDQMLAGTKVLWPSKEDYYNLMVQLVADGPAAFSSEKQNEPLSDDERRFLREWIQYYDDADIEGKELYAVTFVDPSMGKNGGDYSAIVTVAIDSNGQCYILDVSIERRHPDLIITDTLATVRMYPVKLVGVEDNQFQEFFKDTMKTKMEEEGFQFPIRGIKQVADKVLRIQSLQPDIKNGRVKFRRDQQKLIEQLVNFPSADHDDGPDALEGAMGMINRKSGFADFYKDQANESNKQSAISYFQNTGLQGTIK